jgi:hypothetical protein
LERKIFFKRRRKCLVDSRSSEFKVSNKSKGIKFYKIELKILRRELNIDKFAF